MSAERLQKVLASAGIASRRDCEAIIAAGRVMVNGRVVQEPGLRVDPEQDVVLLDGQPVRQPSERTYIMLHKPVGVVSTADDLYGRPTVVDLVDVPGRVFPVGRLDVDSEGLILLTDDGELTHHLTHPKFEVEKEYRVLLDRPLDADALRRWRSGVMLNGEMTAPATVAFLESTDEGHWHRVVLREGRKRQIREVAKLLGYEVLRLIRVREGELQLGDLPVREWRKLTPEEVKALRAHVPPRREGEAAAAPQVEAKPLRPGAAPRERVADDAGRPRSYGPQDEARPARGPGRPGGYGRDEREPRRYDERPPRERSDFRRDERPPRGGYGRDEREPRRYDERPPRERSDFRRDERPPRGGYGRDEREGRGGYDRDWGPRRYDDRPPRERSDFRRDQREPRRYDDRPPRERSDFRRDERPPRGGYGRDEREPRRYDERPPREGNDFRGGYGRDEWGPRRYDERPPRGGYGRDERPPRGGYGRDERPPREGSDFRGGYGRDERSARRSDERRPRERGDSRRDERPPRGGYGRDERESRRYDERPPREGSDFRGDYGRDERSARRSDGPQDEARPQRPSGREERKAQETTPAAGVPRGRSIFRARPGRPKFNLRPRKQDEQPEE